MRRQLALPVAAALLTLAATAAVVAAPGPATKPATKVAAEWKIAAPVYDQAPEPWRSYLLRAREADAIADPMQRCLAFPPFPGSQWAPELLPAHCEWAFGLDFTLDTVRKHLDAGDHAGLEKRFRELHERHSGDTDFSEHIHLALAVFDSSYEAGALSKRWLELAPDSPFALAARADFYRDMGWSARGGAWSKETPDDQMQRLKEFHAKSEELYLQALAKEPRLIHAHAGLLDIANNRGAASKKAAFEAGRKLDPACKWLLDARMRSLEPRWGGSYEEMFALEQEMLAHLPRRPLLALSRIWPYDDMRHVLYAAEKYVEAAKVLLPMVPVSSSPQVYEGIATAMAADKNADRWQQLAYLVEPTRFRSGSAFLARERGRRQLLTAGDATMANRSLAASVAAEPDSFYGHYLYAASFGRLGKFDEAEREYLLAMKDKPETGNHRDGLIELAELMVRARRGDKARLYARRATVERDDARSWLAYAHALAVESGVQMQTLRKAVETFLAKVDTSDPRLQRDIAESRKLLADMRAIVEKQGGKW